MIARFPATRRRTTRVASVALLAAGAIALAGCGGDDSSSAPEGVAGYVPATAPLYFEATTVFDGPQWTQVQELGRLFPAYPDLLKEMRDGLAEDGVDFERDVRPLLGDRAAVAITDLGGVEQAATRTDAEAAGAAAGESVLGVIDIAPDARAKVEDLLTRTGGTAHGEVEGATIITNRDGDTVAAVTDDVMLMADERAEVEAALRAHADGEKATLSGAAPFQDTLGKLPDEVFGLMYADVGSLAKSGGEAFPELLQLGTFANLENGTVAAALIAEPEGLRVKGVSSGIEANENLTAFAPELIDHAPADTLFYSEIADITDLIRGEVAAVRAAAPPDVVEQMDAFAAMVPQFLGVTVDQLAALGEGKQAVIAVPGGTAGRPDIVVLAGVEDGAAADTTLTALRKGLPGIATLFSGGFGDTAPSGADDLRWTRATLPGGVSGWSLDLGDGIGVTYAIDGDLVAIGSSPKAVGAVLGTSGGLAQSPAYTAATAGMPSEVTGLGWTDIRGLVATAATAGAFADAPAEARQNLRPLRNAAFWESGGDNPTFELFLSIGR